MSKTDMEAEEKKWQAENDARTLAEADVINNDPERLEAAQKAAKKMLDEQKRQAEAMEHVVEEVTFDYRKKKDKK
jgi:hypothetical protein